MKESLLMDAENIATEADLSSFSHIANDFVTKFTAFMGDVKESLMESVNHITNDHAVSFAPSSGLQKRVAGADYISLREVDVYVPVGMNCTYLEYLHALNMGQLIADRLLENTLEPASRYFALLCALPENLSTVTVQRQASTIVLWEKERELTKTAIGKCVVTNDNTQTRRFGVCFERLADWKESMAKLADLNERAGKARPDQIAKKVNDICEIVDRLIIGIRNKPEVYSMNGVTAKALSKLILELGELTEFYASHRYLLQTLNAAMADTAKKLDQMKF